jgi:hypothetical protein
MSQPSSEHIKHLIAIYTRRLYKLQEQKATTGAQTLPHILIEIEDIEGTLASLKSAEQGHQDVKILGNLRFKNQIEALNAILGQTQIGNFIIEAPAGYGKTYLLEALKLRLLNDGWYVQMISFRNRDMQPENQQQAIDFIRETLGVIGQSGKVSAESAEKAGYRVATALRSMSIDPETKSSSKGAFLFLDSAELLFKNRDDRPYSQIKEFFLGINQASADFSDFKVRVIISGRYIVDDRMLVLNAPALHLKVFDLSIVQQAVDGFMEDRGEKRSVTWNESFAKHVLYLTGGHPLMIRDLLTKEFPHYTQENNLDTWVSDAKERIKNNIVKQTIGEIRKDIPEGDALWNDLLRLSVFRRFNKQIIRLLFPDLKEKPFQYTDKLERYSLITRDDSFYRDGVLRPAMICWLQATSYEKLKEYCADARKIFIDQLEHPSFDGFRSTAIVRELLYIALLELHTLAIDADASAIKQSNDALISEMQGYVNILRQLDHIDDIQELTHDLYNALLGDNDIVFLYDYIFRRRTHAAAPAPDYSEFVHHLS